MSTFHDINLTSLQTLLLDFRQRIATTLNVGHLYVYKISMVRTTDACLLRLRNSFNRILPPSITKISCWGSPGYRSRGSLKSQKRKCVASALISHENVSFGDLMQVSYFTLFAF